MKLPGPKTAIFLLLCCFQNSTSFAQLGLDSKAFRKMPDAERFQFVHHLPFGEMDSAALTKVFNQVLASDDRNVNYKHCCWNST